MAEALTGLRVGKYKAGFWHLAFEKGYVGFCQDIRNMNHEDTVDKERCDIAWRVEISRLHLKWIEGDGKDCAPAMREDRLAQALFQPRGEAALSYWGADQSQLSDESGLTDADLFNFLAKPQAAAEPTPEALMREHKLYIEQMEAIAESEDNLKRKEGEKDNGV